MVHILCLYCALLAINNLLLYTVSVISNNICIVMQNEGNDLQGPHSAHVSLLMKKSMQNTNYLSGMW